MNIGFIGAGGVSNLLLTRLVGAGHAVAVYAQTDADQKAGVTGGRQARTFADLCHGSDVIVSLFDDDHALLQAASGPAGLVASMAPGTTHVALGLHSASTTSQLGGAHSDRGQCLVAAPMLLVTANELAGTVVAAGPRATVGALAPLFQALHVTVFNAGETPQTAATLSLIHAGLVCSAAEAMAEAFALVRKYGVDPHVMHDVITDGLFRGSWAYGNYGIDMLDGVAAGGQTISVARALAILDLLLAAADETKVPLTSIDACRDRLLGALAHGGANANWTALSREQARASGLD